MEFKFDENIKQEYLSEKSTSTASSDFFVLRLIDNYEESVNKAVYNFSISELNELFVTFKNSSQKTGDKNKSILVTYIDFCKGKNMFLHGENRARFIDVKKYISRQALLNKYVSKEKMIQYSNTLYNSQDRLFLWLLYIGVKGKTVKNDTFEELINLTINDVKFNENSITLWQNNKNFRILDDVPSFIMDLIKETYEDEAYIENNNEITNNPRLSEPRKSIINKTGEFSNHIFRKPGKNKFDKFSPSLFNSRFGRIKEWTGAKYITATSIYESGMLQLAMDIYKERVKLQIGILMIFVLNLIMV
jgi:integrase